MRRTPVWVGWLLAFALGAAANAGLDRELVLGKSRSALGAVVGEHRLVTARGPISMGELRGAPLVINPVFTSCHRICPALTSHLARVVDVARGALGEDSFNVLTVGFDAEVDTPQRMATYGKVRGIDDARWHFASGDGVSSLLADIGFSYEPSPRGFDHLLQTTILDADGRVFRHVYGGSFEPPLLVEPIKDLLLGSSGAETGLGQWIETVRLFCTVYDPDTGRYRFDYSVVVAAVVGGLCLAGVAAFLIRAWRETLTSR